MATKTLLSGSVLAVACLAPWLASAQPASSAGEKTGQSQASSGQSAQGKTSQGNPVQGKPVQGKAGQDQAMQGRQVAQQCRQDLTAFRGRVEKEGYWLTGYRQGYGWNNTAALRVDGSRGAPADMQAARQGGTPAAGGANPGTGSPAARGTAGAADGSANRAAMASGGTAPWGGLNWNTPPAQELGTLYRAAAVLAQRGEEQACQTVLGQVRSVYGEYAGQLREAGVEPGQMVSYRQQQLAAAQPVTEMRRNFRADTITGTDVRNPQDESLGSVEDVVLNPGTGGIGYVILSRGGFLGLGEDYIAVPWARLRATPQMDSFVLPMSEAQLEKAPSVDPDSFADGGAGQQRRQEIDRFWQQSRGG
ncbi:PRC-barrel domain-containing protein [Teichococcus aestuarii]|uniref:PRC-barrel domain-containing protein n=1 Tax=Teichococcus aestuarii TaxID=568898 RepID=A0A2U1V434_9PROT|nr:PRC-barrel domain-containing protein [Pseudoroseomonas aestuarii]PWC28655.1 hypothetical protein CR165_11035 [Pseudoroseomonas aestuarii]